MKRKRFIKLSMGVLGLTRNEDEANAVASMVRCGSLRFRNRSSEDAEKDCEAEKEICKG